MDEKIFRDTKIQIGMLRSRGIIINNEKWAKKTIRNTNYYNLINGYKEPFLQKNTVFEKYLSGTTIEEIYALYEFDRKLRILTIEYVLTVEKQVKSLIAYCFSKEYGHRNYLKLENFDIQGVKKYQQVCKLISDLYRKIITNIDNDLSITHYVSGKNYVPLWVLVNSISMGEISKFYSSMKQKERADVARRMKWGLWENQLASCLFFLSSFRNRCAHDERTYSYLSYSSLCNNNYFRYFHIGTDRTNNYFAVMVALKMVLDRENFIHYSEHMGILFDELASKLSVISVKKIRNIMGIPNNWRRLRSLV